MLLLIFVASLMTFTYAATCRTGDVGPITDKGCQVGYAPAMYNNEEVCCPISDIVDGQPPTTSCVDKVNPNTGISDCPAMVSYCTNASYRTLMSEQCPKTCGLCGSGVPSGCFDKLNPNTGISDCTRMKGYCNDPVYFQLMTEQCPATCGRC